MSVYLQFHSIDLNTDVDSSSYSFTSGLNAVIGSYGTGKSSLFELIKFALGARNVKIMPTVKQRLRSVVLNVTLGSNRMQLQRNAGENHILVSNSDGTTERWTATGGKLPAAGDRLLERVGIPSVRLSKKGAEKGDPLTFFDLYRYVYLPQSDVNLSVAGHADRFLNRKRKAIFELTYGLSSEEIRELELEISSLETKRDNMRLSANAVKRFLGDVGAPEESELHAAELEARAALTEAEQRLQAVKSLAYDALPGDQESLRSRISALRVAAADTEAARSVTAAAVGRGESLLAQLDLDVSREMKANIASTALSGLEFSTCPRCLQSVGDREIPVGHCLLCQQVQTSADPAKHQQVVERLTAQRDEAAALLKQDSEQLNLITSELDRLRLELNHAASELERQADPARLVPSIDLASDAATERELARARLRDIARFHTLWDQYGRQEAEIAEVQRTIESKRRLHRELISALEARRIRLSELGEIFNSEIEALQFAGYERASIDPETYLPLINDDSFEELSVSGARKTLANVAYYLSNLGYSLSSREIKMPSALILDSPRTSLGNTQEDIAAGKRLYYRMHLLSLAYPACQIIVADNGLPGFNVRNDLEREVARSIRVTELTYERPLLRGVPHPGRGNVETIK
ncbi:AAA family ATPase [Nonomuraea sp. K274]|uniref:AAA family ATPase n=1 Tax=Nonomuraea cypriaca TaxID=1187855 RepID=A0A931AAX3_9ACTN|nr:AAA family ATPase [Nonomuraea cypriaca]MBF8185987.1 AAA family ATPase [Nonomuraea cypriaca]